MTTPIGGNNNNLLGGGTLAGANPLQQSIDSLTTAVNTLSGNITSMGGTLGGTNNNATRQQGAANTQQFPRMQNFFQPNTQQGGIGGGGPGGAGNVSAPSTFGSFANMAANNAGPAMMLNGLATWGAGQMSNQLTLNQYATTAQMGTNGMTMQQAYQLVGASPGHLLSGSQGIADNVAYAQALAQLGGTVNYNASPLGRAGAGAAAAFGIANPTLGTGGAGQAAAGLYSTQMSMNALRMGLGYIRSTNPNGSPVGSGNLAVQLMQRMNLNPYKMTPAQIYGNLASPVGQANLGYLTQGTGVTAGQMGGYLQTYSQLLSHHYNPQQAQNLLSQAYSGSRTSMAAARKKLAAAGVSTANNDISNLTMAGSTATGNLGDTAAGFNDAISQSTNLIGQFNTALGKLLKGPLGTALGYGGGIGGMMSSIGKGGGMGLGLGGALTLGRMFGLGGAGGAGAGGLGGLASATGPGALAIGAGALAFLGIDKSRTIANALGIHHLFGLGSGTQAGTEQQIKQLLNSGKLNAQEKNALNALLSQAYAGKSVTSSMVHNASIGGGAAASIPSTGQSQTKGQSQQGGISSAAKKAVGKAESQLGVPYQYGEEQPGVAFDCSGLINWAYGQAGVRLPRTSQAMWSSLRKNRIPLSQVQEGDIVFAAGSDGSASSPGHVGLMISKNELVQAPSRGKNVQNIPFSAGDWIGAARPTGSLKGAAGGSGATGGSVSTTGSAVSNTGQAGGSSLFAGNAGQGPGTNSYGSANEVDIISAMGGGGGGFGGGAYGLNMGNAGGPGGNSNGSSGSPNKNTGANTGNVKVPGGISGSVASVMKKVAAAYGWTTQNGQWQSLVKLENNEAGFNLRATNPSSGAYGIAQFIDGPSEYYKYGGNPNTAEGQAIAMMNYIKGRYGSPAKAWAFETSHTPNWYGAGGVLKPGVNVVGERGPELALNSGGKTQIISNSQTSALINAIKGNVAQSPWQTGSSQSGQTMNTATSQGINVTFGPNSIIVNSNQGGGNTSIASSAGREVARQIVKHINQQAVSQAIRGGNKL